MAADMDCIEAARHLTRTTHFVSDFSQRVDPTLLLPDLHISEEHKEEVTNICHQFSKHAACQKLWEYLRREVGWPQNLATALERRGEHSDLLTVLVKALPNHCRRGAGANAAGAPQAAAPRRRNRNRRAGGAARPPPPEALRHGAPAPGNRADRNPAGSGILPAADLQTPPEAQPQQLEPRHPVEEERGPYRGVEEEGWDEPDEKVIYSRQSPQMEIDPSTPHEGKDKHSHDDDDDDDDDDKDDDHDDDDKDEDVRDDASKNEEKEGITVGDILKQAAGAGYPASPLESSEITDDMQTAADETIILHSDDEENPPNTNENAAVQPPLSTSAPNAAHDGELGNDGSTVSAPQYPSQASTIDLQLHRQRQAVQEPWNLLQEQQGNQLPGANNASGVPATGNEENSMPSFHVREALRAHQPTGSSIDDRQPASPPDPTSMANPGSTSALAEASNANNSNLATFNSCPSSQFPSSTPSIPIHPGRASNHTNVSPTEDSGLSPPRPSRLNQLFSSLTDFFNNTME